MRFDVSSLLSAVMLTASSAGAATIFVPADQPTIQDAINAAVNGDAIEVDGGTYPEKIDFLGKQLLVYSAKGAEITTIDATGLGGPAVTLENGEGLDTILEGFTLTGGTNFNGGGVYIDASAGTIRRCVLTMNQSAGSSGSALVARSFSQASLVNCLIFENTVPGTSTGAVLVTGSSELVMTNCTVVDNVGELSMQGGGVFTSLDSTTTIVNSIIRDNSGTSQLFLATAVSYSNIQGTYSGNAGGNIDVDPLFVDVAGDDYRLSAGSPSIDAGDDTAVLGATDLARRHREVNDHLTADTGNGTAPLVDMGALEHLPPLRYVRPTFVPEADGITWATAYSDLQDALDDTASGAANEVWVEAGSYTPDRGTGDRSMAFGVGDGVNIYGGFAGGEFERDQADPAANVTILGGAIGAGGTADNSYHVVVAHGNPCRVEGFSIRRGNCNGAGIDAIGGGVLVSFGGAAEIVNCKLRLNTGTRGVAIGVENAWAMRADRCWINNNTGSGTTVDADGIAFVELHSCLVIDNTNTATDGIIRIDSGNGEIINCTVAANAAPVGLTAGILQTGGSLDLFNNILWGNDADNIEVELEQIQHLAGSIDPRNNTIQGLASTLATLGPSNNATDPGFADEGALDFSLTSDSKAIDSGDDALAAGFTLDVNGDDRFFDDVGVPNGGNGPVDRGAIEFVGTSCAYDCGDGDGQIGVGDLLAVLADWGSTAGSPCDYLSEGGDDFIDVQDLLELLAMWGACP